MTAVRWGVRLGVCYLLLQSLALAQVTTADIVGRVTDATGAVLPGATVTTTNEGTGDVRSAPTTESGDYAFNVLPIGRAEPIARISSATPSSMIRRSTASSTRPRSRRSRSTPSAIRLFRATCSTARH